MRIGESDESDQISAQAKPRDGYSERDPQPLRQGREPPPAVGGPPDGFASREPSDNWAKQDRQGVLAPSFVALSVKQRMDRPGSPAAGTFPAGCLIESAAWIEELA